MAARFTLAALCSSLFGPLRHKLQPTAEAHGYLRSLRYPNKKSASSPSVKNRLEPGEQSTYSVAICRRSKCVQVLFFVLIKNFLRIETERRTEARFDSD